MDIQHFDRIAKLVATRHTRRATVGSGVGLAAAAALSSPLGRLAAQEATPENAASEVPERKVSTEPHPNADIPADPEYLFVQPFASGTWTPKPGEDGVFTLTLTGAPAQTVYFSDRPARIFGLAPTGQFLERLGFTPDNPPNAALVASTEDGVQEVLVIKLLNPVYDEAAGTLTYDAKILADYSGDGLSHVARQQTDFTLPASFTEGGLFIDDCADGCATCYQIRNEQKRIVGQINTVGRCFKGSICIPCNKDFESSYYGRLCHEAFPDHCGYWTDATSVSWDCFVEDVGRNFCP